MDEATIQFLKQIGTALSCTVVLGIGCYKLWGKVEAKDLELKSERAAHDAEMKTERDRHATEEKAKDEKIYSILAMLHGAMKGD